MRTLPFFFLLALLLGSCTSEPVSQTTAPTKAENPPAEGFDMAGSDSTAQAIADAVMHAMGGRTNWDATRYLTWNFFGARSLLWDKHSGWVRITSHRSNWRAIVNVHSMEGQVFKDSVAVSDPDSLAKYLDKAKSTWINDAYWLVMPYKLKDSGVTLKWEGKHPTESGTTADVLSLTFSEVGDTPENKYLVWVDTASHLVSQWSYYRDASDEVSVFVLPWGEYEQFDGILLSGYRGENYALSEIGAPAAVPEAFFTTLDPQDWSVLLKS
ncbi:MAG: hypothetical protein AAGB22_10405 [Bacteroidota bacterium]